MQIDTTTLDSSARSIASYSREAGFQERWSYADVIAQCYMAEPYKTRDEINDEDTQLQAFKEDLTSKGALRFFVEFNLEKIEKMVEEYRAKLEANAKENPDERMDIENLVTAFRKQLMEQLMNDDEEKAGLANPNRAATELLPEASKPLKGTLESLLRARDNDDADTVLI
jgi:hypothetical protein